MKLAQQVTNLELSKRLKELGVKQESEFYWEEYEEGKAFLWNTGHKFINEHFSAFTVAELGEMLPKERYWTDCKMNTGRWRCAEYSEDGLAEDGKTSFCAENEADARAKMLIYLLEHKLIELLG